LGENGISGNPEIGISGIAITNRYLCIGDYRCTSTVTVGYLIDKNGLIVDNYNNTLMYRHNNAKFQLDRLQNADVSA